MTLSTIASLYDGMSKEQQIHFLARMIHELTIIARGFYSATPQIVQSASGSYVGVLNEIQHRLAGHLEDVLIEAPERATGQGIVENIFGWASHAGLEPTMQWAMETTLTYLGIEENSALPQPLKR